MKGGYMNSEQEAAVDAGGLVFVSAGAGTGKTKVLVQRGRPDLARALDAAWISTIHGFCHRLLRSHPFAAGVDPRFRVLDESQGRVVRGEAFEAALTQFCANDDPARLRLLAVYGADGLRRMLTGVYETLRSAGRELVLELGERPELETAVSELREAARCLADDAGSGDAQRETARQALVLLEADTR